MNLGETEKTRVCTVRYAAWTRGVKLRAANEDGTREGKRKREKERERGTRPPSTTHLLFSRSKLFPPFRVAREVEKAFESRTPDG